VKLDSVGAELEKSPLLLLHLYLLLLLLLSAPHRLYEYVQGKF
jgi:hypothetical protein